MKKRAYTLVEIMTVVGIIGMITAIAVPNYFRAQRRASENALRTNLAVVRSAVEAFRLDCGSHPATLASLTATTAPATGIVNTNNGTQSITASEWRGPYLRIVPTDPISGTALAYTTSGVNIGAVNPSATGNDSNGVAFSTY
jgi:general secretion pathway protein G